MRKSVSTYEANKYKLYTHRTLSDRERKNLSKLELDIRNRSKDSVSSNTESGLVAGLEIGHTAIVCTLTDLSINVIGKSKTPSPKKNAEEIGGASVNLLQELIKKSGREAGSMKAIGIGASDEGIFDAAGMIEKKIGVETFAGNDTSCAAFGEKMLNPEADAEDLLYMHSDIGCGIVIKGDIYFGAGGNAGDMQFSEEGIFLEESKYLRPWGEDLGIVKAARREVEKGIGTRIVELSGGSIDNITKEVVIEAARQNDEVALVIINNAGMNLGIRIAYLVNLFNPELVVVGGGVEQAGELLLGPIRKAVKKLSFAKPADIVKIIPSAMGEDAVSLGAAALAAREIFLKE